jgi:hypothetical protein
MVALVSVLLPYVLIGFSESPQIVWGIPLLLFGLANCGVLVLGMYGIKAGPVESVTKSDTSTYVLLLIAVVITIALLLSGIDLIVPQIPEMLILGAIWAITMAAWGFVSSIKRVLQG